MHTQTHRDAKSPQLKEVASENESEQRTERVQ